MGGKKKGSARPQGVTFAVYVHWAQIALLVLGALALVAVSLGLFGTVEALASAFAVMAAITLVATAAGLAVVNVALRAGHDWARVVAIVFHGIGLAGTLLSLFTYGGDLIALIPVVVSVALVAVLTRPEARRWCRDQRYLRDRDRRRAARDARRAAEKK